MVREERTPQEWFEQAARTYVEGHQACAWCGGAHRVFQSQRGSKCVYFCNFCDFCVEFDVDTGAYLAVPGEDPADSRHTMLVFDI